MNELKTACPKGHEYINKVDKASFVDYYTISRRYDTYASFSESFNNVIREIRELPYFSIVLELILLSSNWFNRRREESLLFTTTICPKYHAFLCSNWNDSHDIDVRPIGDGIFLTVTKMELGLQKQKIRNVLHTVDINKTTVECCNCGMPKSFDFPCQHLCAVYIHLNQPIEKLIADHCSP